MRVTGAALFSAILACAGAVTAPALAQPTPTAGPQAGAGSPVCQVAERHAVEISGMAIANGFTYVVNDSTDTAARKKVFKLDAGCETAGSPIGYPTNPLDPEDMAVGPDGVLWVGDIGDNDRDRSTVALWKIVNNKIQGPYRLSYPDGKKHDAEALLIGADGLPIIITKAVQEPKTYLYVASGELQPNSTSGVPLTLAGEVTLPKTQTDNVFKALGRTTVTGAAMSPDRSRVVLRTYADAFEWAVPDGDIVKALTMGKPKVTPLPNEIMGESITYSADGTRFWTVSETAHLSNDDERRQPTILSYVPSTQEHNPNGVAGAAAPPKAKAGKAWWSSLLSSTDRLYLLIGGIGVLGALLVLLGVIGILKSRRRRRAEEKAESRRGDNSETTVLVPAYGYEDPNYGYYDDDRYPPHYGNPDYGYQDQGGYHDQGNYGQQYR